MHTTFAVDNSFFKVILDSLIKAILLNNDLRLTEDWATQVKMSFNPDPFKQVVYVIISKKKNNAHPNLSFNHNIIGAKDSHKHLGMIKPFL